MPLGEDEIRWEEDKATGRRFAYRKKDGRQVCGARRNKGKPGRCANWQNLGPSGRCRLHGGAPGTGGPIRHGRYSKVLGRLADAYEESRADATLSDLREPISLLDVAVKRAAKRAAEAETAEFRKQALELWRAIVGAGVDWGEAEQPAKALGALLTSGVAEDQAFEQLVRTADRLAHRVEQWWQVRLAKRQVVNAKDLTAIFARLVDEIRQNVPEPHAGRVIDRVSRLVGLS